MDQALQSPREGAARAADAAILHQGRAVALFRPIEANACTASHWHGLHATNWPTGSNWDRAASRAADRPENARATAFSAFNGAPSPYVSGEYVQVICCQIDDHRI